jgi:hypothetical protein
VPRVETAYLPGTYESLPLSGIIMINSHAFNTTKQPTTMEQYYNFTFATSSQYQLEPVFFPADNRIFEPSVPPFEARQYCRTFPFPVDAHVVELSSHMHQHGKLFRIWGPPNTPCGTDDPGISCDSNLKRHLKEKPLYLSTVYNDPVRVRFDPPLDLRGKTPDERTFLLCARYDNGMADHNKVKRASKMPAMGKPCATGEPLCIGGPNHGHSCHANSECPGSGDCDACTLNGGFTSEDEMFILLGSYYIAP